MGPQKPDPPSPAKPGVDAPPSGQPVAGGETASLVVPSGSSVVGAAGPRRDDASAKLQPGDVLADRYRLVRFIAKGGMGEVFEAEDLELKSTVALKIVKPDIAEDPAAIERFKREIKLSLKVTHANVCRIFDLGHHRVLSQSGETIADVTFLTMELLNGETLAQRLAREGKLTTEQAQPIVEQIAAALSAAHDAGIVHRDLKASNVMLVSSPKGERAVVGDFGLAHGGVAGESAALTGLGTILGTPAYMAPEQLEGARAGPAVDIYALGVVIFEMVTGRWPFLGESAISMATQRLHQPPPSPRELIPGLDPTWDAVILRCLARKPEDRFPQAPDVVKALRGQAPAVRQGPRWGRRHAMVVAVATLGLGAGYALWRGGKASSEGTPARTRPAVAVIGFKNLGRPDAAWVSVAASEMLRTELAAGEKLRTIPGETVSRMKLELPLADTDSLAPDTLARVRSSINADYVVVGSYLTLAEGSRIRMDPRLQDTQSGEIVVSVAETGSTDEIFEVVSRAGAGLRAALGLGAVPQTDASRVRASLPASAEATRLYADGLARLRVFEAPAARDLLQRAVAADPDYPMAHAALASAWSALGYDGKAREEAQKAFDLSRSLTREERLLIEGSLREMTSDWGKTVDVYRGLFVYFPDNLEYGLRLSAAQTSAGTAQEALKTIESLRTLPGPGRTDARVDLAEAAAAKALTDATRQNQAATAAAEKARMQGARLLLGRARLAQGSAQLNLRQFDVARRACEEARSLFAAVGDRARVAEADNLLGVALANQGQEKEAVERFESSLATYREIGDRRGVAKQLVNLGNTAAASGNQGGAKERFEEALTVSREIGDRDGEAMAHYNIGVSLFDTGELQGAALAYQRSLEAYTALGASVWVGRVHVALGEVREKERRPKEARQEYETALALLRQGDSGVDLADGLVHLSGLDLAASAVDEAAGRAREAAELYRTASDPEGEAAALGRLADALDRAGRKTEATAARKQAADLRKR